ncbi:hypothetical protein [Rhizobium sp. CAU 1783]
MSEAYLIAIGGRVPADKDAAQALYAELIADINSAATRYGWEGADFAAYRLADGRVYLEAVPGPAPLTLERLKIFRDEQRQRRDEEERQVA